MNWLKQIDPNALVAIGFFAFIIVWFTRTAAC
jgi:preprotein translocase subunit Sec61beta